MLLCYITPKCSLRYLLLLLLLFAESQVTFGPISIIALSNSSHKFQQRKASLTTWFSIPQIGFLCAHLVLMKLLLFAP
ncbi:hypothetical protein BP00DRAFT_428403 [Aspergillus indologenus CBS 114.80]|uniref:Uncharacterized protein n=1 Tax=Aspergillus indologenus CBS 114.80 TaxID=1450541 RepID=A0A2V5HVD1_9EURO|nr:hypothetical protein BP00DRAFT_428403 [Aspergillus indologenus CBS 114.80]